MDNVPALASIESRIVDAKKTYGIWGKNYQDTNYVLETKPLKFWKLAERASSLGPSGTTCPLANVANGHIVPK